MRERRFSEQGYNSGSKVALIMKVPKSNQIAERLDLCLVILASVTSASVVYIADSDESWH